MNFVKEARLIEESPEGFVRKRLVEADGFDIDIYVYNVRGEGALHTCGRDEFFYVLRGEVEMLVEDQPGILREGDSVLVKAGIKHKHTARDKTWMLVISKWPHEHTFF